MPQQYEVTRSDVRIIDTDFLLTLIDAEKSPFDLHIDIKKSKKDNTYFSIYVTIKSDANKRKTNKKLLISLPKGTQITKFSEEPPVAAVEIEESKWRENMEKFLAYASEIISSLVSEPEYKTLLSKIYNKEDKLTFGLPLNEAKRPFDDSNIDQMNKSIGSNLFVKMEYFWSKKYESSKIFAFGPRFMLDQDMHTDSHVSKKRKVSSEQVEDEVTEDIKE